MACSDSICFILSLLNLLRTICNNCNLPMVCCFCNTGCNNVCA